MVFGRDVYLSRMNNNIFNLDIKYYMSLSVPDEGYSRNASCALNLISTFLMLA